MKTRRTVCGIVRDGEILNDLSLEAPGAHGAVARRGGGGRRRAERHDGRPGGSDPRSLDGEGHRDDPDRRLLGEVRICLLRPIPRGCGSAPVLRRPARLPDGSSERPRSDARCALDLEEGADVLMVKPALPYLDVIAAAQLASTRRSPPTASAGVRHDQDRRRARLARRAPGALEGWLDVGAGLT